MPDFSLSSFEQRLIRSGIAPRHVFRASAEIHDHLQDLHDEARADGLSEHQARQFAEDRLGDLDDVAVAISQRVELRTWSYRYPHLARVCLPVAYVALLPAAPIFAGVSHAPQIARWGISMMLGAAVTAAILLALHLSIVLA